jgi:nucleoside-diphosphate-sugar epimerase
MLGDVVARRDSPLSPNYVKAAGLTPWAVGTLEPVRIAFIGGTYYLGPVAVPLLREAGHEVVVAHSGAHEHPSVHDVEHLHGSRAELLGENGRVERWTPDVLVDTFAPGATSASGDEVVACAKRCGVRSIVAVSSIDVYQHCVDAGMADGSGTVAFPPQPLPIDENAPLRMRPYPGGSAAHDNVAMEAALRRASRATVLRPGAIYGPYPNTRERYFVERIRDGNRTLKMPDRGQQMFHRVAVERVARAIVAAVERAPDGFWACNVVDPYDWTFAGLAAEVARVLAWEWEPVAVPFAEADHPWAAAHPILASDRRLREVLRVEQPNPRDALERTLRWLWEHRSELLPLPGAPSSD